MTVSHNRLAALALAFVFCAAPAVAQTPDADLAEGIAAFNRSDPIGAMAAFRRAAEAGSADAKVWLGWILDQAEENDEAVRWYREAAADGSAAGKARLAEMYAKGDGVARDPERARALFEEAAGGGYRPAMLVLAAAYRAGDLGLERDEALAAAWQARAEAADADAGLVP